MRHARRDGATGSPVSPGHLAQRVDPEFLVGEQPFEPAVLAFKLAQPLASPTSRSCRECSFVRPTSSERSTSWCASAAPLISVEIADPTCRVAPLTYTGTIPERPEAAPTGLVASSTAEGVQVDWSAPVYDATSIAGDAIWRRHLGADETTLSLLNADTGSSDASYLDQTATVTRDYIRVPGRSAARQRRKRRLQSVDRLSGVLPRAAKLYEADPESRIVTSDPRHHQLRQQQTFRRARAAAVVEAIESSGAFEGLRFFASSAAPIGDYEVHTCAGVPAAVIDALPAFDESVVDRVCGGRSLHHEVITECLDRADRALYLPDSGAGIFVLGTSREEMVRAAADRFTSGTVCRATGMPADLFSAVNEFTSLSYERAGASGHLTIVDREKAAGGLRVRFERPVRLRDARIMRKLLELSGDSMSVLADRDGVYGLGSCDSGPGVIEVSVHGHAAWELNIDGPAFLRVVSGHATLPRPVLDFDKLKYTAERTVGPIEINRIWAVIQRAQASGHGTTLVVSRDPAKESMGRRL